ncbi:pyruvate kinase [Fonticula alba]|uniref:Pyruvate kinase n=1 Tax=Fonticula alba TaxID=691883 RepID=A0A058Z1T9_FONAL|nr:pyruvate kinase [Fonticula alba]KCV68235.1 pyruvate kinase [Fonticula alba]|eukprot:XP_009497289.1 pyruvate kinase [Fonticula alba]
MSSVVNHNATMVHASPSTRLRHARSSNPTTTLGHLASLDCTDFMAASGPGSDKLAAASATAAAIVAGSPADGAAATTTDAAPGTPPVVQENVHARRTSIICTIGPKTQSVEKLASLRQAGMNVVRMNMSHGSFDFHQATIDNTRQSDKLMDEMARPVAIALDTKGPEIRTGELADGIDEVTLTSGEQVVVSTDRANIKRGSASLVFIDYPNLARVVLPGSPIYIDDGLISLQVVTVDSPNPGDVTCTVVDGGVLSNRKGVNLPGALIDLPAVSDYDRECYAFAVRNNVDMIFASFIRKPADVADIRMCLGPEGQHIKIIAKIENQEGVNNFDEILDAVDGVMVARGDLGIEIPPERVFRVQKMMIARCNIVGKSVICATQMLESMTTNPRPTRAEVSDVANAVLDGADCVMLSGETAKGSYPIEAVRMMHRICIEAELATFSTSFFNELRLLTAPNPFSGNGTPGGPSQSFAETLACSAVNAALEQPNIGAIIVLTGSGDTARLVSKYRPRCPIITITREARVARQAHLWRGCFPLLYDRGRISPGAVSGEQWQLDVDARIQFGIMKAKTMGLLSSGMMVIAIQGWKSGVGHSNTMRLLVAP